jgi:hypothetical protein
MMRPAALVFAQSLRPPCLVPRERRVVDTGKGCRIGARCLFLTLPNTNAVKMPYSRAGVLHICLLLHTNRTRIETSFRSSASRAQIKLQFPPDRLPLSWLDSVLYFSERLLVTRHTRTVEPSKFIGTSHLRNWFAGLSSLSA